MRRERPLTTGCVWRQAFNLTCQIADSLVWKSTNFIAEWWCASVSAINELLEDILVDGTFQQRDALPEESGEPDLANMPRLVFHFK